MNSLDPNVLLEISTKIAGIDERTKAAEKNADHRHSNIMSAIQNFVPRREIEAMLTSNRDYAETLATATKQHCDQNREAVIARVEVVESGLRTILDNSKWLKRAFISAAITASVAAGAYLWNVLFVVQVASTIVK